MKVLLLILSLGFMPYHAAHKFYVSHYRVDYKPRKESLQISGKIFTDDLERSMREFHHDNSIRLPARDTLQKTDSLMEAYFRYHIYLTKDDKVVLWDWVGKEYATDVTWVYIEQKDISRSELFEHTFHCKALIKEFTSQKNIMDLRFGRQKRTEILTNRSTSFKLRD